MTEEAVQIQLISGGAALVIIIIGIVSFFLCVALFFKIWIMTNDVNKIKDMLREQLDLEHPYVEVKAEDKNEN